MSAAALRRALLALVVLVVAWGAFALFRGSVSDAPVRFGLPKLTPADVDRVVITAHGDTITLAREGTGWLANGYPAAAGAVDDLVNALTDTGMTSDLVARNAASHARMGVDSTAGRRVQFFKGERALVDLVIGNSGGAYQSAYMRRVGENDVYLVRGRLASLAGRDLDAWRDRRIAAVPADSVRAIEIARGTRHATLTRGDGVWHVGANAADSSAVARLLQGLADVSALGFATAAQADSLDFTHPKRALTVLGPAAGDTLLHLAFDSTASGTWVRRRAGGPVFKLDFWRLDQLTPSDSTLRKK
jgi:hypothetical protein